MSGADGAKQSTSPLPPDHQEGAARAVPAPEAAAARAAAAVPPPAAKPWLTVGAAAAAPPAELQASAKALPFKPTRGRPRNTPYECQICGADLTTAKYYHKRYRICVLHAGAQVQEVDGKPCQWCQQCGRFHALDAFDEGRRTCRVRLTRHAVQKTKRKRSNAVAARGPGPARAGRGTRIDEEEEEEAEQSVSDASSLDPDDGLRAVLPPALHNALRATARESRDSRDAWQGPAARSAFGAFGGSGNGAVHALETAAAEAEHEAPGPAPAPYRPRPVHASCWPAPPPLPPPLPLPPPASAAELLLMLLTSILST